MTAVRHAAPKTAVATRTMPVPVDMVGPRGFAVKVKDWAMTGDDIRPGDVILIDPDKPARPGDLACVTVSWGGGRGKVLRRIGEQGLALESSNPNYPPMILAPESKPVAEGRAVAVIRRLE